jgi:hypothetical protein
MRASDSPWIPDPSELAKSKNSLDRESEEIESFVPDRRALLRPAQIVEGRVFEVLRSVPVLVSHFERPARPRFR